MVSHMYLVCWGVTWRLGFFSLIASKPNFLRVMLPNSERLSSSRQPPGISHICDSVDSHSLVSGCDSVQCIPDTTARE